MTENSTKTIRIKAETLLRLYGAKVWAGMDTEGNMPTLDTVINVALDSYQREVQPAQAPFSAALRTQLPA